MRWRARPASFFVFKQRKGLIMANYPQIPQQYSYPQQPYNYSMPMYTRMDPYAKLRELDQRHQDQMAQLKQQIDMTYAPQYTNQPQASQQPQQQAQPQQAVPVVDSEEAAKNQAVDLSGNRQYFISNDGNEIYVKQFDVTTADVLFDKYVKSGTVAETSAVGAENAHTEPTAPMIDYQGEIDALNARISELEKKIAEPAKSTPKAKTAAKEDAQ